MERLRKHILLDPSPFDDLPFDRTDSELLKPLFPSPPAPSLWWVFPSAKVEDSRGRMNGCAGYSAILVRFLFRLSSSRPCYFVLVRSFSFISYVWISHHELIILTYVGRVSERDDHRYASSQRLVLRPPRPRRPCPTDPRIACMFAP
ncbi:hypothetical protein Hypma_003954 [Hypsizygus marmoreus]|uniref:Uncharacterized protein n=1 Tax=Hypsizygus marmoreus TaxID=39966 RepID=A0A369J3F8_HYPMA|nr:hypothetical protein Hypma_003954 [Hypsizygus marmoreus]